MVIEFTLPEENLHDQRLKGMFCDALVDSLRQDIKNQLIPAKYEFMEQGLLNATWIRWDKKPKHLRIPTLINAILKCITWRERIDGYQIYFRTDVKMPYTVNTTLEQVARFLDKGNLVSKCSTVFSRVFDDYEKRIPDLWKVYLEIGYFQDITKEA